MPQRLPMPQTSLLVPKQMLWILDLMMMKFCRLLLCRQNNMWQLAKPNLKIHNNYYLQLADCLMWLM